MKKIRLFLLMIAVAALCLIPITASAVEEDDEWAATAPTISSVVNSASSTATVKWKKVADADGYVVQYSTKKGMSSAEEVTVKGGTVVKTTITGLSQAKYYFRVAAYKDEDGDTVYSDWSEKKACTISFVTPTLSSIVNDYACGFTVTWEAEKSISGYQLQYSKKESFKSATQKNLGKSVTSTTIKGLEGGETYYFRLRVIKTIDGVKKYSSWSTVKSKTITFFDPAVTSVKNNKPSKVTVKWEKAKGASGFEIQYSENAKFSSAKKVTAKKGKKSINIGSLKENTVYYFRVRSYKTVDSKKRYSDWGDEKSCKITFFKPTIKSAVNASGSAVTVKWGKVSGAGGFEIQYAMKENFKGKKTAKAGKKKTEKTIKKLKNDKTYYVRMRAWKKVSGKKVYTKWSNVKKFNISIYQPSFTKQPAGASVKAGETVKFSAAAKGGKLSYQWQYRKGSSGSWTNCTDSGNNTANMTVKTKLEMNGYQYRCVVSNIAGTANSKTVSLTVIAAPAITKAPVNTTATAGGDATFSVTASGNALTYQWQVRKDSGSAWENYTGADAKKATIKLTSVTMGMNGYQYRCLIENAAGSIVTDEVTLTVKAESTPVITDKRPGDENVKVGASVTFTVRDESDSAPIDLVATGWKCQWQIKAAGSSDWVNYTGSDAKQSSITLNSVTLDMNGNMYRCIVSNDAGSITSREATLNVSE